MEIETKYNNNNNSLANAQNIFSNHPLKNEIDDDFCIDSDYSSKDFLQEFQNLDHFTINGSSFNPDLCIQNYGFDPFDPFSQGLSPTNFDNFYEENGATSGSSVIQNFQSGGVLNNPSKRNSSSFDVDTLDQSILRFSCQDVKPINFVVPDENSYVTADDNSYSKETWVKKYNKKKSATASGKTQARANQKSKSTKGQWTAEEDRLLIHLVEKYGVRKWSHIAQVLQGRIGKQCRERWHNHLRPDIKKDVWTEEEDRILIQAHIEVGNKWAEISKRLKGRTENSIKNHWNATKRRQFSRRKCRTKWPRPSSLLQNYIKGLNLENGAKRNGNLLANEPEKKASKDQEIEAFCSSDRLVPEYDFSFVIPEFGLDDKLFEGSSIDSLIDDIPNIPPPCEIPPLIQFEVKKELDLMEMISQSGLVETSEDTHCECGKFRDPRIYKRAQK